MDLRKIKKLIDLLEASNLSELEIKEGEEVVRLARMPKNMPVMMPAPAAAAPVTHVHVEQRPSGAQHHAQPCEPDLVAEGLQAGGDDQPLAGEVGAIPLQDALRLVHHVLQPAGSSAQISSVASLYVGSRRTRWPAAISLRSLPK